MHFSALALLVSGTFYEHTVELEHVEVSLLSGSRTNEPRLPKPKIRDQDLQPPVNHLRNMPRCSAASLLEDLDRCALLDEQEGRLERAPTHRRTATVGR